MFVALVAGFLGGVLGDWPQFRGPAGNGVVPAAEIPLTWSGAPRFKERLEGTGPVVASPIAVGERLIVVGESGRAVVLAAKPSFEVAGGGQLDDVFWSTPAVAGDALLLRGDEHLYCLRSSVAGG